MQFFKFSLDAQLRVPFWMRKDKAKVKWIFENVGLKDYFRFIKIRPFKSYKSKTPI